MNYFDYIIIAVLFVGFILGFKDGMVRKIIGLLGIIIGLTLAIHYSEIVGNYLSPLFNSELYLAQIIAGLLIFIVTIFIASVIKRVVHPLDKVNRFLNQFMGGLTGTIQILFFLSVFLLFLDIFSIPSKNTKETSLFYGKVYQLIPSTIDFIIGEKIESKQIIKDYIEGQDSSSIILEQDTTKFYQENNDQADSIR